MKRILFIMLLSLVGFNATAQNMPERGEIRRGNRLFNREDYKQAIESYDKAITYSPASFEANYNLGNAHYKDEDFTRADEIMTRLAADSLLSAENRAEVYYNLGNSQFQQQKYKEALESYKSSMRLNHADTMTKYNYAYTKRLLEQQQEQENQDNQDNQDQNQDNQDGQDNQDNQDGQDEQDEQEQNQEQDKGDEQEQNAEPQPQEGEISQQQLEQILNAIQAQEDKTQEKLDEEKAKAVIIPSGKNW